MNQQQYVRQVRRAGAERRVRLATRWVAAGAAALAVVFGVVFAQQATGASQNEQSSSDGDTSSTTTPSQDDDGTGGWLAPGVDSGGTSHGSSGGS